MSGGPNIWIADIGKDKLASIANGKRIVLDGLLVDGKDIFKDEDIPLSLASEADSPLEIVKDKDMDAERFDIAVIEKTESTDETDWMVTRKGKKYFLPEEAKEILNGMIDIQAVENPDLETPAFIIFYMKDGNDDYAVNLSMPYIFPKKN